MYSPNPPKSLRRPLGIVKRPRRLRRRFQRPLSRGIASPVQVIPTLRARALPRRTAASTAWSVYLSERPAERAQDRHVLPILGPCPLGGEFDVGASQRSTRQEDRVRLRPLPGRGGTEAAAQGYQGTLHADGNKALCHRPPGALDLVHAGGRQDLTLPRAPKPAALSSRHSVKASR